MSSEPLVETAYIDAYRQPRTVPPDVRMAVLAAMGLLIGTALLTGTLRGRHRALSGALLLSTGIWIGSGMVTSAWVPQARHAATMPAWSELSQEAWLDIAVVVLVGLGIILCYSFGGSKKE